MGIYELAARFDSRASFYGKAYVVHQTRDDDCIDKLYSYSTHVASIIYPDDGERYAEVYGWYSNTTGRHIREFLKQGYFYAGSKQQILNDYFVEEG